MQTRGALGVVSPFRSAALVLVFLSFHPSSTVEAPILCGAHLHQELSQVNFHICVSTRACTWVFSVLPSYWSWSLCNGVMSIICLSYETLKSNIYIYIYKLHVTTAHCRWGRQPCAEARRDPSPQVLSSVWPGWGRGGTRVPSPAPNAPVHPRKAYIWNGKEVLDETTVAGTNRTLVRAVREVAPTGGGHNPVVRPCRGGAAGPVRAWGGRLVGRRACRPGRPGRCGGWGEATNGERRRPPPASRRPLRWGRRGPRRGLAGWPRRGERGRRAPGGCGAARRRARSSGARRGGCGRRPSSLDSRLLPQCKWSSPASPPPPLPPSLLLFPPTTLSRRRRSEGGKTGESEGRGAGKARGGGRGGGGGGGGGGEAGPPWGKQPLGGGRRGLAGGGRAGRGVPARGVCASPGPAAAPPLAPAGRPAPPFAGSARGGGGWWTPL